MLKSAKATVLLAVTVLCLFLITSLSFLEKNQLDPCNVPNPNNSRRSSPHVAAACQWQFVKYSPSSYELYWTEDIEKLQTAVCEHSNLQPEKAYQWGVRTEHRPTSIFSYFTFKNNCTGETLTDFIEPLAGLTRSPLYCLLGEEYLVSKDYLVVSWNVSKKVRPPAKAFFFDLGASLYNSGNGGASQSWFEEMYTERGVEWDGIFAWEATPQDPAMVWSQIPQHLKPVYHWFNIPVNSNPEHPDNALDYIRATALPQDFVVLKLDIDNTPVEEMLVQQIMDDPWLLGLIDEFYFEHHVNTQPMNNHWGTQGASQTLADSYTIFTTLRSKGVIAHSWV